MPKLRYPITTHAAQRFLERCQPELLAELSRGDAFKEARLRMRVLMAYAEWHSEWPVRGWLLGRRPHGAKNLDDVPGYLQIDDDTVFVLVKAKRDGKRVVATVLTRDDE